AQPSKELVVTNAWEEIVEERIWRTGVEIVSRVNWTQIARVRQSLGVAEGYGGNPLQQVALARAAATSRPIAPGTPQLSLGSARLPAGPRVATIPARLRTPDFAAEVLDGTGAGVAQRSA
ncbi:MAG: hypothetical protein ABI647_11025, partial [Gemmatimonadota bacterium]